MPTVQTSPKQCATFVKVEGFALARISEDARLNFKKLDLKILPLLAKRGMLINVRARLLRPVEVPDSALQDTPSTLLVDKGVLCSLAKGLEDIDGLSKLLLAIARKQ